MNTDKTHVGVGKNRRLLQGLCKYTYLTLIINILASLSIALYFADLIKLKHILTNQKGVDVDDLPRTKEKALFVRAFKNLCL